MVLVKSARMRMSVLVAGIFISHAALAGLGESADAISHDRTALRATAETVTPLVAYDVHEMTTEDGSRVREYVSRSGTIFAVAWNGRTKPDLSALLAAHYADYLKAAASNHFNHHVLSISNGDFAMRIMKLPRGFTGSAHVPALLPTGTTAQDIR
jgi:hypothetical protein